MYGANRNLKNKERNNGLRLPDLIPLVRRSDTWIQSGLSSSKMASNKIPWNDTFLRNKAIPSGVLFDRSYFPISRNRPWGAKQRRLACNFSSARELSTTWTPRPFVPCITWKWLRNTNYSACWKFWGAGLCNVLKMLGNLLWGIRKKDAFKPIRSKIKTSRALVYTTFSELFFSYMLCRKLFLINARSLHFSICMLSSCSIQKTEALWIGAMRFQRRKIVAYQNISWPSKMLKLWESGYLPSQKNL